MSLDEVIAAYLLPYDGQTYKQYRSALRAWLRWCDLNDIDPLHASRSHIEAYCQWLGRAHPTGTVRDNVGAVRRFYRFLTEEEVIARDPGAGVRLPRKYRRSTGSFLTVEQARMWDGRTSRRIHCGVHSARSRWTLAWRSVTSWPPAAGARPRWSHTMTWPIVRSPNRSAMGSPA